MMPVELGALLSVVALVAGLLIGVGLVWRNR